MTNENEKALQALPVGSISSVKGTLKRMQDQFASALPQHIRPEKFMRIALTEVAKNPLLLECTQESFYGALLQSAAEGLTVGSVSGEAWLIPRKNKQNNNRYEVNYQRGYKGLYTLAKRSGEYKVIDVGVIKKNDPRPIMKKGDGATFSFEPDYLSDDRGEIIAYYCYTELTSGEKDFTILTKKEAGEHEQKFRAGQYIGKGWRDDFDAMAKKTVFIKHMQFKPKSSELSTAIGNDNGSSKFDFQAGVNVQESDFDIDTAKDVTPEGKPELVTPEEPKTEANMVEEFQLKFESLDGDQKDIFTQSYKLNNPEQCKTAEDFDKLFANLDEFLTQV